MSFNKEIGEKNILYNFMGTVVSVTVTSETEETDVSPERFELKFVGLRFVFSVLPLIRKIRRISSLI